MSVLRICTSKSHSSIFSSYSFCWLNRRICVLSAEASASIKHTACSYVECCMRLLNGLAVVFFVFSFFRFSALVSVHARAAMCDGWYPLQPTIFVFYLFFFFLLFIKFIIFILFLHVRLCVFFFKFFFSLILFFNSLVSFAYQLVPAGVQLYWCDFVLRLFCSCVFLLLCGCVCVAYHVCLSV